MTEKLLRNKGRVHQTVSAGSRDETGGKVEGAGGPLICRSVQATFTPYVLMETDTNRMTPHLLLVHSVSHSRTGQTAYSHQGSIFRNRGT